jgi:hypothetical protein
VQGQPDPLQIVVQGPTELECVFPELPTLAVALRNRDPEKRAVGFVEGGNYRTGRQERWRFQVHDARGRRLPVKESPSGDAGGIFGHGTLRYGEGWNTSLHMRSFVEVPEPGEYRVQILYHDSIEIAAEDFVAGRNMCRSPVLRLRVKRRVVELSDAERADLKKWLEALDEKGPVQVVGGPYGKWAHALVPPETPAGRLLTAGWKAVPVLLDGLTDERLTDKRRAWFLALLWSIIGGHDSPWYPEEVLGDYQSVQAGWQIWGNRDGEEASGGMGFRHEGSGKGMIDGGKQRAVARQWLAWKQYLDVRPPPAGERSPPAK